MNPTLQASYDLAVAAFGSSSNSNSTFCDNDEAATDPAFACVNGLLYCVLVAMTFAGVYWFLFSFFVLDHSTPGQQQRERQNKTAEQQFLLSAEQVDLVAKRRWKEALTWIVFHPDELQRLDRQGQSFLHHACLFRAPADIIQMILWRAPELAALANPEGQVPLHWAVRLSVPNESLQALILAAPETACCAKDTLDGGHTPLSLLWDRHKDSILTSWWAHQNGMEDRNAIAKLHSWKRILLCFPCRRRSETGHIEYHANDSNNNDDVEVLETPLHVASRSPCPPGLYPFLLQVFSKDAMRRDDWGSLPLHVACSNAATNRSTDVSTKLQAWMRGTTADPRSACYATDYQGRTPFHVALASGISWDEGIKDMVELDPEWMLHGPATQDPVTLLEPFLLAAADGMDGESNIAAPLDTIYKLLRMDPTRIAAASYKT